MKIISKGSVYDYKIVTNTYYTFLKVPELCRRI